MKKEEELPKEYYSLMEELQSTDFVLTELSLYLNTHPFDQEAINQFNSFAHYRKELANHFESKFGPLLQFGHSYSNCPWEWSKTPWPWQV